MPKCSKCNSEIKADEKICPECGQALGVSDAAVENNEKKDRESNTVMAVLAYLGPLVFVPIFAAKKSKYARFHANQGLILFIVCAVLRIITELIGKIPIIGFIGEILGALCTLFGFIMSILGIINVIHEAEKELPWIGKYRLLK